MRKWIKRLGLGLGVVLVISAIAVAGFAWSQTSAFDASLDKVYDVPAPDVKRSTDPEVIALGKHLAESFAACATGDCHGADLAGGRLVTMGPVGQFQGPNITSAGLGATYTDGELARLMRHGVKKDGRGVRMMPVQDFNWISDDEIVAIVSYIRTLPAVEKPNGVTSFGTLGKILDRQDQIVLDVARRIDHAHVELAPPPSATAEYGKFIARGCQGCHGTSFSGGPIPGVPKDMAVPLNLTPDPTGLAGYTYEDFDKILQTGTRKDGRKLDKLMPFEALAKANDTEKRALFLYLQSLPPRPFGQR